MGLKGAVPAGVAPFSSAISIPLAPGHSGRGLTRLGRGRSAGNLAQRLSHTAISCSRMNCHGCEEEYGRRVSNPVLGTALCQITRGRGLAVRERGNGEGAGFGVNFSTNQPEEGEQVMKRTVVALGILGLVWAVSLPAANAAVTEL